MDNRPAKKERRHRAVRQGESPPVVLGNLTAKHESNAGAARFGRKERNKNRLRICSPNHRPKTQTSSCEPCRDQPTRTVPPVSSVASASVSNQIDSAIAPVWSASARLQLWAFQRRRPSASFEFHVRLIHSGHIHRSNFGCGNRASGAE